MKSRSVSITSWEDNEAEAHMLVFFIFVIFLTLVIFVYHYDQYFRDPFPCKFLSWGLGFLYNFLF
jgi:hypothetical protein